jgi:hypothetical protein
MVKVAMDCLSVRCCKYPAYIEVNDGIASMDLAGNDVAEEVQRRRAGWLDRRLRGRGLLRLTQRRA